MEPSRAHTGSRRTDDYRQAALEPKKPISTRKDKLAKVWNVVKWILLAVGNVALFFANPTLWAIGFVVGIIWDKKVQVVIDKVILIWKKKAWLMALIAATAGFLSIQVTLAASSFAFGANLGSLIARQAKDAFAREKEKHLSQELAKVTDTSGA